MQIEIKAGEISQCKAEALILGWTEKTAKLGATLAKLDKALGGILTDELLSRENAFQGKLGDTLVLPTYGKISARYVILTGLGQAKTSEKSREAASLAVRRAAAAAIRAARKLKVKTVASLLLGAGENQRSAAESARLIVEGALLGAYQFTARKGKPEANERPTELKSLLLALGAKDAVAEVTAAVRWAETLAQNVNLARDWVNDSANYVTPAFLKETAEALPGLTCQVLDFAAISKLGMGAFELVAQGSEQPPYLIHLAYKPKGKAKKKVALVGKGITFDSGGLSLKTAQGMELMKMDMGGAAAVLATLKAVAELKDLPVEVHGFIPTCENMPSGRSSKPGDIVTTLNGKTVEVNNTDAEGRLILCDALTYAQQQVNPDELIDLATLTGACIVALGKAAAGIMGTGPALIEGLRASGERAGEKFWELPLYDEYKSYLKSDAADLINAGAKGEAGSSAGGMFLKEFVDTDRAWAHLDIAGPAWLSTDLPEVPKGGTGFGVRALLYYLYGL